MFISFYDVIRIMCSMSGFPSLIYLGVEWNIGFMLMCFYVFQVLTGVFLGFFFMVCVSCLFSKSFIVKEICFGWFISYFHLLFPNFLFSFLFFHMMKCFDYPVYVCVFVWSSGFLVFFMFILVSFTGYSLVFGSLGFWAVVVVSNMFECLFGELFSYVFFSDFSVLSDLILFKIFTYHYLFSLFISVLMYLHLYFVHDLGSSIGCVSEFLDLLEFSFFSLFKDSSIFISVFNYFGYLGYYVLEKFFSLDNFEELDLFKVPFEMNSEWYLSIAFILLSGVNKKSHGVVSFLLYLFSFLMSVVLSMGVFGELFFSSVFYDFVFLFMFVVIVFSGDSFGGSLWISSFMFFCCIFFSQLDRFFFELEFFYLDVFLNFFFL